MLNMVISVQIHVTIHIVHKILLCDLKGLRNSHFCEDLLINRGLHVQINLLLHYFF